MISTASLHILLHSVVRKFSDYFEVNILHENP